MSKQTTRSAGQIAFATLISRILGLCRDMVKAYFLGTSMAADAFTVAFRIPSMLRQLLGEGALSAAFVPTYTEYLTRHNRDAAWKLVNNVITLLMGVLLTLTAAGVIFSPQFVQIIARGFDLIPGKLTLTVTLTRILFPYIFFVSLAALAMGILNSHRQFFIPALAPVMLNISLILSAFVLSPLFGDTPEQQVFGFAIGGLIGGMGQLAIQLPALFKLGLRYRPQFNWRHPGVVRIVKLMIPGLFGIAIYEINLFADTFLASLLEDGSIAALEYGNRLVQLPLGAFATAIGTAILPALSEHAAHHNVTELKKTFSHAIRLILLILIPATVGLILLADPMIRVLLQRGAFDASRSLPMTTGALTFYAFGLCSYGLVKGIVPVFYAMKDTQTPVKTAAVAMLTNITLNIILMRYLQLRGLALATALSATLNVVLLWLILNHRLGLKVNREIGVSVIKTLVATAIMGGICWISLQGCYAVFPTSILWGRLLVLFIPLILSLISFVGIAHLMRHNEIHEIIHLIRQKRKPVPSPK
ncbi:MAG: murein biosynthesis integral membrane protein MurJ [Gemmatimonadetes bacterium]|nr:MAG: murein biosynthesis integral membrane protein MurJ [Gemmatimonadota bacterium]